MLRRLQPHEVPAIRRDPVDSKARLIAEPIVEAVRKDGAAALRKYAEQFGELQPGAPLLLRRDFELRAAYEAISQEQRKMLERTAARIRAFAAAQRASVNAVRVPIPGGEAGHTVEPVEAAGCYAPGGRYPLPSTVLMTAVTARVAGCKRVVVASPKPSDMTKAAAYVAEADVLLAVGGAHAIAALAYGAGDELEPCDAVVGPGNQYGTRPSLALVARRLGRPLDPLPATPADPSPLPALGVAPTPRHSSSRLTSHAPPHAPRRSPLAARPLVRSSARPLARSPAHAPPMPRSRYVTAAKSLVAGRVAIDMLAGPSECIVLADESAQPSVVASDLLAQAEHDPQALPALICLSEQFACAVDDELRAQLAVLGTAEIAAVALKNGYTVVCESRDAMAAISDKLGYEPA